jgi:ribosomal protein L16/L10AE
MMERTVVVFPHAVAAERAHHFARRDGKGNPEKHVAEVVAGLDIFRLQQNRA